jgi:neutral ceramidase
MPDSDHARFVAMSDKPLAYKAGAASVRITPDEPLWLAGYASRTAPARGKISDLFASALALEDSSGQRFVIASMDLIAITPIVAEPVAEAVRVKYGLARQQLLLTATHTHYGPEFRSDKAVFFKIPVEYAKMLPDVAGKLSALLMDAIGLALERLEPVRLFARSTSVRFAHNRRRHGVVAGSPSSEDVLDHDVPVLDCIDATGNRKAVVFGYACHNTTIPPEDLRYCGDWTGFAKEQVERSNPGATALFIPGAGADQDPEPSGSIELARQHGQELADAIERALDAPGVEISGPIRTAWEEVSLPLRSVTYETISEMLRSGDPPQVVKAIFLRDSLDRGEPLLTSHTAPIQVVRFGNELLLIALSGEPVVDWSHKLKQGVGSGERRARTLGSESLSGSLLVWVAGYCNDMFGYLPTRRVQSEGGYEGGRANLWSSIPAPFTEDVEDRISDAVRKLIDFVHV